jgi:hypothetical protein
LGKIEEICMGVTDSFYTLSFGMNNKGREGKRAPELEQEGWVNLGACWSVLEHIGAGN